MKPFKAMVWAMALALSLSVFFWMPAVAQEDYSISNIGIFGGWVGKMVVKNNYAFMVQGTGFIVMDISNPLQPKSVASLLLPDEPTDFTIYGNTAFFIFSGKGLYAANISNPLTPVLFDSMLSLSVGYDSIICVAEFSSKIYAYILNRVYEVFHIINVTDPSDLKLVKSLNDPVIFKKVKNMVISGNRAFMVDSVAYGISGSSYFQTPFYVVDMTDPENPAYKNILYNTQGVVDSMYIHQNKLYLGIGSDYMSSKKGLQVFNVSNDDPSLFQDLGLYSTEKVVNNIFINGNYAYLGMQDTLMILDISNFPSDSRVGSYIIPTTEGNFPSIKSVYADSSYAFLAVSGDNNNLYVLNVSTPSDPKIAHKVPSPWEISQTLALGDRLYVLSNNNLWIYSLMTPASPSFLGNLSQPINGSIRMFAEGNYVYVAQLLIDPFAPGSGQDQVTAINAADPAQMTVAGTYRLTNRTFSGLFILAGKNGMLYLLVKDILIKAYWMEIVDMTNPGAPVKKGEYSLLGSGKAIAVENTTAYIGCQVSDTENKLLLVNVANPTALSSPGSISLSGRPTCIVPKGNTLFVGVNTSINPNKWKIEVFDVSTLQKITETAEGNGTIFGMEIQNDTIFAGIHGGSVYIYIYENNTLILKGVCPSGSTIGITTTTPNASGYGYVYTPEGYASDQESRIRGGASSYYISGSRGVIIQKFKAVKPISPDCCITTTVSPPEAKDDGCSAAPVRSPDVECNSKVNVSATASSPWIFKEWTGAASGTNPTTEATASQKCSEAIAHFVKGCCVTTTVFPKEAEEDGCIAEPAKSPDVECNSKVNVSATASSPWIFKEWTGAASGTNPTTEATASERCSGAIAYFVLKPSLKIEAGVQNPKENTEVKLQSNVTRNRTNVVITHITLITSAEDTWRVTQVEFESFGTGNEAEDIAEARLYRQSVDGAPELIGKLTSFTDNGTLTFTIDERIPPASTISLILVYDFKPNKVIPCKTYGVKIDKDKVKAYAVNYPDYVKFSNPSTGIIGGPTQVNGLIWTGDVNGDGKTDLTDVVIVLKILVGLIPDTDISCYMKSGLSVEANKLGLPEVIYMLQVLASVRAH